jgi:ATP/ADP translocase
MHAVLKCAVYIYNTTASTGDCAVFTQILTGIMMVAGAITIALYEFIYHVHQKELAAHPHSEHALEAKKPKDKVKEQKFIRNAFSIVIESYHISISYSNT